MEKTDPDGPADLRRRRLRQDRDRRARRVQGRAGRQAGRRARADDAARQPAPVDVHRALCAASRSTSRPCRGSRPTRRPSEVKARLADGTVDVVIGTHRILSSEVRFKDLGLVIVDEEQRFGVEHKEQLKHLRTNVDVLTMSATPIPRTLEMAVTGIREMSTILTPPEERHPVLTFVGGYDEKQIGAAIRRELLRDGQIFFIHNRVESIDRAAARLRDLVPEARIATAHGQMNEHALEQRGQRLLGEALRRAGVHDDRRERPGHLQRQHAHRRAGRRDRALRSLHQLRGRVGRGRERAYAYFLYPPEKPLTETAHDRLATIAAHSDLGAGMYVAMKDLEIRGAGNLLGGEQSGHIAARRLRPLRAAGRRGGRRLQGRGAAASSARSRSSCRSTPTCRTTTSRASGCGSRPTASWPSVATEEELAAVARRARRPLWRAAGAGHQPGRGGAVPAARPARPGCPTSRCRAQRAVRPGRPAGEPADAAEAALPGLAGQAGRPYDPGADTVERPIGGSRCATSHCCHWCREVIDTVLLDGVPPGGAPRTRRNMRTT